MIRTFLFLLASSCAVLAQAQTDADPVDWTISHGSEGDAHAVLAEAKIADGWYVYSQFLGDGGPVPTTIDLTATEGLKALRTPEESGDKVSGFDSLFEMEVTKFKHFVAMTQAFTLPQNTERVTGYLEYMACTEKKCLPPQTIDIDLSVAAN